MRESNKCLDEKSEDVLLELLKTIENIMFTNLNNDKGKDIFKAAFIRYVRLIKMLIRILRMTCPLLIFLTFG